MKHWFLAARPKTLMAIIAPVLMAAPLCGKAFDVGLWLLCLLFGITIQIGTNLSNDYFDFLKGSDTQKRKGPVRVCQAQLIDPIAVRNAAFGTLGLSFLTSLLLSFWGGIWIAFLGAVSVALSIAYTAGPYALAYLGLGDLFVMFFFGPVALGGTHAILTGGFSPAIWLLGLGPGLLSTALLVVNNTRDIDEDRLANKKTLTVRFGRGFSLFEYVFCWVGALVILALFTHSWIPLLLAPLALYLIFRMFRGENYNQTLALNGMALGLYSGLFLLCLA